MVLATWRCCSVPRPAATASAARACSRPRRWEIRATVVGRVTDTARFRIYDGLFDAIGVAGENPPAPIGDAPPVVTSDAAAIADVPVESLGDGPLYHRPLARPAAQDALQA